MLGLMSLTRPKPAANKRHRRSFAAALSAAPADAQGAIDLSVPRTRGGAGGRATSFAAGLGRRRPVHSRHSRRRPWRQPVGDRWSHGGHRRHRHAWRRRRLNPARVANPAGIVDRIIKAAGAAWAARDAANAGILGQRLHRRCQTGCQRQGENRRFTEHAQHSGENP